MKSRKDHSQALPPALALLVERWETLDEERRILIELLAGGGKATEPSGVDSEAGYEPIDYRSASEHFFVARGEEAIERADTWLIESDGWLLGREMRDSAGRIVRLLERTDRIPELAVAARAVRQSLATIQMTAAMLRRRA